VIRQRFSELSIAVVRCIEVMRVVRQLAEIPQAVLKLLGQAACSERAIYWTVDPVASQPQASASWGAPSTQAPTSDWDIRYRAASLSQGHVGRVWRSGRPLWSASFVLDTAVPSATEAGPLGAVWFAVKTDSTVYAVIELLGRALEPNPPNNLVLIEQLGYRLGYGLEELCYGSPGGRLPWKSPGADP
jgi:hypothetical protein